MHRILHAISWFAVALPGRVNAAFSAASAAAAITTQLPRTVRPIHYDVSLVANVRPEYRP